MTENMEYTESGGQITVTGGFEGRSIIEIPDSVNGSPVTALESYAFAHRLELAEVILPASLKRVGAHAFYNCKKLGLVELHDGIRELEDGAFKNCHSLCGIRMHSHGAREGCIRNLLDENIQEVTLDILYDDGQRARLLFPTFEDDYVENTPARIFQSVSYGSGGAYRRCMQAGTVDYRTFDGLFERSVREDRFEAALFNAVGRLMYPYRLFASARQKYFDFLRENAMGAALYYIGAGDAQTLDFLCSMGVPDGETVRAALEAATAKGEPRLIGILMDYKSRNFGSKRKSFEL